MNTNTKIEVQDIVNVNPSEEVQFANDMLIQLVPQITRTQEEAIEVLALTLAELVVHNHGNLTHNIEKAKALLAGSFEHIKVKHASCIEDLVAHGELTTDESGGLH